MNSKARNFEGRTMLQPAMSFVNQVLRTHTRILQAKRFGSVFLVVRLGLLGDNQARPPGSTREGAGMQGGPCQPFCSHVQPLSWPEAPTLLPPGLSAQLGAQKDTTERKENG